MKENDYNMYYSGAVYFVGAVMEDGNVVPRTNPRSKEVYEYITDCSNSNQHILANRPAVIISRDDCNKDSVLVAFLTRRAVNKDQKKNRWYEEFSPNQEQVVFTGGPATVLCSHISRVETAGLAEFMGDITQEELNCIVKKVRESGEFDHILPFLYQPEDSL